MTHSAFDSHFAQAIFDDPDVPIGKCFHMISACNAQNVFTIKEYLNSCSIVWYDSPAPVSWTEVIKASVVEY
jgi:nucleosome binding factor SPN SPT16 subunit